MDINLEKRSKVLEYSLILEKEVNELILLNLGILDGGIKTRLFGSKPALSFKNKIDFLYDIEVLTKEENSEFELMMIFRNKFLHDIDSNSYISIVSSFDNGLKNKFKRHLEVGEELDSEESCRKALSNLFLKNIKTLKNKAALKRRIVEEKNEIFQLVNNEILFYSELFYDLIEEILTIVEASEIENKTVKDLPESILEIGVKYLNKSKKDEDSLFRKNRIKEIFNELKIKKLF